MFRFHCYSSSHTEFTDFIFVFKVIVFKKLKIDTKSWQIIALSTFISRWRSLTFSSCSMQAVWTTILQTAHFLLRADFYNSQFKIQERYVSELFWRLPCYKRETRETKQNCNHFCY